MIIVSGRILLKPGLRERFLAQSDAPMRQARAHPHCRDFVVAADPIDPNRVNVYEEWDSEQALEEFRGAGMDDDLSSMVVRAEVGQRQVD